MKNIAKAFSPSNIGEQAKALPKYMSQIFNPTPEKDYLTKQAKSTLEDKKFMDKGLQKNPDGSWSSQPQERVPMPPVRKQGGSPTATPTSQPTQRNPQQRPMVAGASTARLTVPQEYRDMVRRASEKYDVPSFFLSAVLQHESMSWNPDVINGKIKSPVGAMGVAQFMPETVKYMEKLGFKDFDPLDPEQAIFASAAYLASLKKQLKLGSWYDVAAAYNAGPGNFQKYQGNIPFPETQNYIKTIQSLVDSLESQDDDWLDKLASSE